MRNQHQNGTNHQVRHYQALSPAQINRFGLVELGSSGPLYRFCVRLFGILALLGIVGFMMRVASSGFSDRAAWGYYVATVVFIFVTFQAAPTVAFAIRAAKGHWRRPVSRIAELFAVVGVLNLILLLPVLFLIPPITGGRKTFWFELHWLLPFSAPGFFLFFGMLALVVCGLCLLYLSALPDFAAARDAKGGIYTGLARGWVGSQRQWKMLKSGLNLLGAFYLMTFVLVTTLFAWDVSETLVPGWKDAIYPAFHSITGLQGAIASTILALGIARKFGGLKNHLHMEQFWGLSKPLLATSLLWFYMGWSTFLTYWYGRTLAEQHVLQLLMFGPYFTVFVMSFLLKFLIPLLFLIWNRVRMSIMGPVLIALSILTGDIFEMVRLYVGPFTITEVGHEMTHVPAAHLPDFADILIIAGAISGAIFIYLVSSKIIPRISLWDMKEGMLLTRVQSFHRAEVLVIGKPE
ncbi:MAG: hypothetical protein EXR50_04165 [Dehalococcoidia bacterium]|nr:hypothetical protein [Dehalococcoidia bacterium]